MKATVPLTREDSRTMSNGGDAPATAENAAPLAPVTVSGAKPGHVAVKADPLVDAVAAAQCRGQNAPGTPSATVAYLAGG